MELGAEPLPSMPEVLGSIPSTKKKKSVHLTDDSVFLGLPQTGLMQQHTQQLVILRHVTHFRVLFYYHFKNITSYMSLNWYITQ